MDLSGVNPKEKSKSGYSESLISVIIPMYGRVDYIDACLTSITQQTYKNIEVLCVMDGFSDSINRKLLLWAEKDFRIRIFSIEHQGPAAARNWGMENALGQYLFFVDADDLLPCNALGLLYDEISRKSVDVVIGDYLEILDSGEKIPFIIPSGESDDFNSFLESVTIWHRLYRASFIKCHNIRFDTRFKGDDRIFCADLFLEQPTISVLHECIYYWLRHDCDVNKSITHSESPTDFLNHMSMWNVFMDKMNPLWHERLHDHMRYSCIYILDRFNDVQECDAKMQAFKEFQTLVGRIQWDGYDTLFEEIFHTDYNSFVGLNAYDTLNKFV